MGQLAGTRMTRSKEVLSDRNQPRGGRSGLPGFLQGLAIPGETSTDELWLSVQHAVLVVFIPTCLRSLIHSRESCGFGGSEPDIRSVHDGCDHSATLQRGLGKLRLERVSVTLFDNLSGKKDPSNQAVKEF